MPLLGRLSRGPANPLAANGSSNAPTANTAVVTISAVPAGKYIAHVFTRLTGTVDEVQSKRANLELRSSANPAATFGSGFQTELALGAYRALPFEMTGAGDLTLNAKSAATASTVYNATLILERIA